MWIERLLLVGLLLACAGPSMARTAREISSAELRAIVSSGQSISLKSVVASLARSTQAQPLEARAFEADGVFYRVVLKQEDGTLFSVIIDGATGKRVKADSAVGKSVSQAADASSAGRAAKGKSATAGENGQGNSNGNAGGNGNGGGGNGNGGNSGGNGNGGGNN